MFFNSFIVVLCFKVGDLSKATSGSRNVDDYMKTIADWKSKTHLNILESEDNDENNIRSGAGNKNSNQYGLNNDYSKLTSGVGNGGSGRSYLTGSHRTTTLNTLENQSSDTTADSIKAEKYQNIVNDLKKKYTRSRTEVGFFFFFCLYECPLIFVVLSVMILIMLF